ncbi:hypothetical protein LCGC14_0609500 [marine sediment metagenome]|uniref:Uncharacterized protein n=1 Tax=marine sediment metagenome TaxID=412755 RepID=A0A0F9R888_9ZZZZ
MCLMRRPESCGRAGICLQPRIPKLPIPAGMGAAQTILAQVGRYPADPNDRSSQLKKLPGTALSLWDFIRATMIARLARMRSVRPPPHQGDKR